LTACAAHGAEDWLRNEALVRRLDGAAWERVMTLSRRHGMVCLIARNLAWTKEALGFVAPIQPRLTALRRDRLARQMLKRAAASRVTGALTAQGLAFAVFKGFALAEEVYGDIALRAFGDCDILVPRQHVAEALAVLAGLGYEWMQSDDVPALMARGEHGVALVRPDGMQVDLHWALADEIPTDGDTTVWAHLRPAPGDRYLPGLRLSPELTLVHLAAHFHHHNFSEFRPLVDFYYAARRWAGRIDLRELTKVARALNAQNFVELAARLCDRHFIAHPAIKRLIGPKPAPRVRVAAALMGRRTLLLTERSSFWDWYNLLRRRLLAGSHTRYGDGLRSALAPTPVELATRFGCRFKATLYPRYYGIQLFRVAMRSERPFRDFV
jgi:hypothetical protein